jgi:hypothetical protein
LTNQSVQNVKLTQDTSTSSYVFSVKVKFTLEKTTEAQKGE